MIKGVNTRELILGVLLEVNEEGKPSHLVLKNVLTKYQFLPKQDRAFITRVCEGTLEYRIQIDYIIDFFSKVKVEKMKPVIREILRSGVYQLGYMDSVPDSAVCNEAVKLAQKKGFYNLKPFVNGVLRTIARELDSVTYPSREEDPIGYLSVEYSMPPVLAERWVKEYGELTTEKMLVDFLQEKPVTIRCRDYLTSKKISREETVESLKNQGIKIMPAPYLDYAYYISGFDHIYTLDAFREGRIHVQDVSSMLVAEAANPQKGDYVIDLCASPGGKSFHVADKMEGYGMVDARDVTPFKADLILENMQRLKTINVKASVKDATILDAESECTADIVLADVPCSGYGVIGKKPDIKYHMTPQKQKELVILQRTILDRAAQYVKSKGVLIYSTCTIAKEENQENVKWFQENYPFQLESLAPYLPEDLKGEIAEEGYLQLLPGVHKTDGFFLARFRRK